MYAKIESSPAQTLLSSLFCHTVFRPPPDNPIFLAKNSPQLVTQSTKVAAHLPRKPSRYGALVPELHLPPFTATSPSSMRFLILFIAFTSLSAADRRKELEPFLDQHCYACHDDLDAEGDLNLLDLPFNPSNEANRKLWERIFERVENGEMPPKKKKRPAHKDLSSFLTTLEPPLIQADRLDLQKSGRVNARRLTAQEYENSLHDLLGIDIPLADELTPEAEDGFDTHANSQQISHFHLNNYLKVGDSALEEAFTRALKGDQTFKKEYSAKQITKPDRGNNRGPQFWKGKAISWAARIQFAGRITSTRVPESGHYRVTIHNLDAVNPGPDGYTWGTLQTGSGYSNEPLLFSMAIVEATTKPTTHSFEGWITKDHLLVFKPNESGLKSPPNQGGGFKYRKKDFGKIGLTGFRFEKITIERIYPNASRRLVRTLLFGDLDPKQIQSGGPDPQATTNRLIKRFASRAFRRPLGPNQLAPYQKLAATQLKAGKSFPQALRAAYHAILCSPHFLTFVEKPGPLDDHAIATRLSFLLWKTLPDGPLRKLADAGQLRQPKNLHAQISRLLADKKSERFIKDFTDQWLDLRNIDATQPDPRRFRSFELPLQESMLLETRAFITELIKGNHPITQILKSDFALLNTRLRDHYRLKNVKVTPGGGLQKVPLEPLHRSGLLTQASILKVTADGSVSSPVLRGVWINERILGRHIAPPPPNTPAIEPDIRGAVSIRDQLAKHTKATSCASCHYKIDPPGFALESYDPIGNYRAAYGNKKNSAKVDPSGVTYDGQEFKNFQGWRNIYLKKEKVLARAFVEQVLRYGSGGEIRFSDRPHLAAILKKSQAKNYGLRTLILNALTSPTFLTK